MHGLRDALEQSQKDGVAIGHFNVGGRNLRSQWWSVRPRANGSLSESGKSRLWCGVCRRNAGYPIYLNADHTHSLAKAVEAARAGFDAIVFDLSALPFEQNVRQTKEAVETLKTINSTILVEGEIGDIGTVRKYMKRLPTCRGG
jgi:fructose-bisphosphate aldolase class II